MSEICPHCRLNTAGQHESHCPLGRALNLAMSIQVEPDDRPFPESQPIRPSVEMDRIAKLEEIVERIMTAHWDLAACQCWVCRLGREAGASPKQQYLGSVNHPTPAFKQQP